MKKENQDAVVPPSIGGGADSGASDASRPKTTAKCSTESWCTPMDKRIGGTNGHVKGLSVLQLMEFATGKESVGGIIYSCGRGDKGVLLNYCPWCGERIDYAAQNAERNVRTASTLAPTESPDPAD